MTDTFIDRNAKQYGARAVESKLKSLRSIEVTVKEILDGLNREITALGSIARLISSEHYGMNSVTKTNQGGNR